MNAATYAKAVLRAACAVKDGCVAEYGYFDLTPTIQCHRGGRLVTTCAPASDDGSPFGTSVPLHALGAVPGAFGADTVILTQEMVWRWQDHRTMQPGEMHRELMDDPLSDVSQGILSHAISMDDEALAFSAYSYIEVDGIGVRLAWDETTHASLDLTLPHGLAQVVRTSMASPDAHRFARLRERYDADVVDRNIAHELREQLGARFTIDGQLVR